MGTSVSLQQTALAVQPGESVSTELRVRNTGDVVDQFSFQPLGDAAPWITVEPPTVRLFPETDALVTVTIAPPRDSSSKPGIATWAVKAVPKEDPVGAAVGEGTVDVGTFVELGAELQPGTGRVAFHRQVRDRDRQPRQPGGAGANQRQRHRARARVRHQAAAGRQPARIGALRQDPRQARAADLARATQGASVPDRRRAAGPGHRGGAGDGEDLPAPVAAPHAPIVLNGNLLQEPIIPKWLLKALLAPDRAADPAAVHPLEDAAQADGRVGRARRRGRGGGAGVERGRGDRTRRLRSADAGIRGGRCRRGGRRRRPRTRPQPPATPAAAAAVAVAAAEVRSATCSTRPPSRPTSACRSTRRSVGPTTRRSGRPVGAESDVRTDRPGPAEPERRPGPYPGADQRRNRFSSRRCRTSATSTSTSSPRTSFRRGSRSRSQVDCDATQIPNPTDPCSDAVSFNGFTTTVTEAPATSAP